MARAILSATLSCDSEREQVVLSLCLSNLASGRSPPHGGVLAGTHGNGKTVLLNWFAHICCESATSESAAKDAALASLCPDATSQLAAREQLNRLGYRGTEPAGLHLAPAGAIPSNCPERRNFPP